MNPIAEQWPYLVLILVGFLPNELWRMLGLLIARGLDDDSEIVIWIRAVATAILAGVIAPPAALASVPLSVRLAAIACGFVVFLVVRRSVFAGVVAGETALVLGALIVR
jgi:hypothetical protein